MVKLGELTDFETVSWPFPDTNNCPMQSCGMVFLNRSSAMYHFRQRHAKLSILCTDCGQLFQSRNTRTNGPAQQWIASVHKRKPLCADCMSHISIDNSETSANQDDIEQVFVRQSRFQFDISILISIVDFQSSDSSDDDDDDQSTKSPDDHTKYTMTLGVSTAFEAIVWRFPNTDKCPLQQCMKPFSQREVASIHFGMEHAATTTICTICNVLFSVIDPLVLFQHYQKKHPNEQPKLKAVR